MKIIKSKSQLIHLRRDDTAYQLGLVPTMGALHEGHFELIKQSMTQCDKTVVSIFVNPLQFNQIDDYISYPKNIDKDLQLLEKCGVDYVYVPSENDMGIEDVSIGIGPSLHGINFWKDSIDPITSEE